MFESCLNKQALLLSLFQNLSNEEAKYNKIIELGKSQKKLPEEFKTPENLVIGCQSKMYLHAYINNGLIYFETESDAIISAGLGVLLTQVYSEEPIETIFKCPPDYLKQIGITSILSPSRSNGLMSLYLKMKQEALRLYSASY